MDTEKKYLDSTGLATLIGKIKVGIENAIKNIQQASTSTYGLTKLSSATDSDAENLAATPKAVKAVKTALDTMSDVVATKADKTALDNYVPLVGDSTIDGELEVASLKAVMVQSNDIFGSVKDSTGNNYGTTVMCSPGSSEIFASTSKNNGADLNNSAALNVSTSGAEIFASSYARSGSGAIYTASMYASPNSASLLVNDEDKETIITPNSLQIKDYGANPQTYVDINVDGITAPKLSSRDIVGSFKDSSGNNYSTNISTGLQGDTNVCTRVDKGNSGTYNTAMLTSSPTYSDIYAQGYRSTYDGGTGIIYTASIYADADCAGITVNNEDKVTDISHNSLQIADLDHTKTYVDINVDGITAPKFVKDGGTSTQILMADGSVKEADTIEDSRYSQFVEEMGGGYAPFIPTESFFMNAKWEDNPEDNYAWIDFYKDDAVGLWYNGEEWVVSGGNATYIEFPYATQATSGIMSAADKTKLDALETAVDALSSATHFIGISSTEISDGNTQKPTINNTSITKLQKGDIVIYGNKEFIWDDAKWVELGDITALAQKVTAIEEALETNKNGALSDTEVGTIFDNAWK